MFRSAARIALTAGLLVCACDKKLDLRPAAAATPRLAPEPPQTPPPEEHIEEGMGLVLRAHPKRGKVDLVVSNATRAPIRVQPRLTVERRTAEGWAIVEPLAFVDLRHDCERPPSECVTLAPGAEFFPPPWLGKSGKAQCACADCGGQVLGELRFVAMSCDVRTRYNGDPFTP